MARGPTYSIEGEERKVGRPKKSPKTTWRDIYQDFCRRHPNLSKNCVGFKPCGYAEIMIWQKDGPKIIYNYDEERAYFLRED